MKIKTSAPGKLMLLGDHAVVYGYPCLVTAVDKRLYVEAIFSDLGEDKIIAPQIKESRFVLETIAYFKQHYKIAKHVIIITKGDFSHQVGLGSSSAVTVATAKALSLLFNLKLTDADLFRISYQINLLIQGVGSGFDIAAATFGKTLYYIAGGRKTETINIETLPLVVGYSGKKADTPFYIRKVAEDLQEKKTKMKDFFSRIAILVEKAKTSLINNNLLEFGKCLIENHKLLQLLGVSTSKLDLMVEQAIKAGALGAKLSGAGGGDCMIALVEEKRRKAVEKAIIAVGGEIIDARVNTQGVKVESKN